ncbi:hypothetical protein [Deinococcus altitudinis]|uniref:hypothetical protein n=1 Tax=Deinococcus altitudinis TaxID=468914 RepID=UPI0038921441
MIHMLLVFLNHPVSSVLPLAVQFSPLQLIAVLLAALASSRALGQMQGRSVPALSAQVMLSIALLSIILASNLPDNDARPDLGIALVLRLVVGGMLVSVWNALQSRLRAIPVHSS